MVVPLAQIQTTSLARGKRQGGTKMEKVCASVKATVNIVCPNCGEDIEIKIENLSNYQPEVKKEKE